ncbi:hypothetical protein HPB47_011774 [Ixodes persulcatus]|uniref:Uncharacterized protein n=1 Tax=Ixodes persulcatus TaxID=34615 RepID=A0AC60NVI4_IXOPE|nr:hypothetical protein HPB47_011774 [Ixodes persulcatus]
MGPHDDRTFPSVGFPIPDWFVPRSRRPRPRFSGKARTQRRLRCSRRRSAIEIQALVSRICPRCGDEFLTLDACDVLVPHARQPAIPGSQPRVATAVLRRSDGSLCPNRSERLRRGWFGAGPPAGRDPGGQQPSRDVLLARDRGPGLAVARGWPCPRRARVGGSGRSGRSTPAPQSRCRGCAAVAAAMTT